MSTTFRYSGAVLASNKETLKKFKLRQNVIIHDAADPRVKHYGVVAGFALNCFGELCVKFDLAVYDGDKNPHQQMVLHPGNGNHSIEIVE